MADKLAATNRWWAKETVAVVTGGNKGIGYVIVQELAKHGLTVVLTARDSGRGIAALETLKSEGLTDVYFHPLEVSSSTSAEKLAAWIKDEFGGIDILVNNAGVNLCSHEYEKGLTMLNTNYFGVKNVIKALFPLLRPNSPAGARIVNVSSTIGLLEKLQSDDLKEKLADVPNLTEEMIDSLATRYLKDLKAGGHGSKGWPWTIAGTPTYQESKIFLNAYTRMLARDIIESQLQQPSHENSRVFVNAACPGLTYTDLAREYIHESGMDLSTVNTAQQGADTIVWLVLLPREGYPMGRFLFSRKEVFLKIYVLYEGLERVVVGRPHSSHPFTEPHPMVYKNIRATQTIFRRMKLWRMKN